MPDDQAVKHHEALRAGFEKDFDCTVSNWPTYGEKFYYKKMAQQDHWLKAGDTTVEMCFIISGLLRVYYIDQAGNEVNQHFYQAGEVIAPVSAIINDEPCQYFIQALEDTELMLADYKDLYNTGINDPEWLRLELKMLQRVFVKSARREARLLLGNAELRYKWFCKEYPELVERLTQYHIASFLGITPVSLSRLRNKHSK